MDKFDEIKDAWLDWRTLPFPSQLAGEDVAGVCVTSLDTFTAGYIVEFVSQEEKLSKQSQSLLGRSKKELGTVIENLDGSNKMYFERLLQIIDKILETK